MDAMFAETLIANMPGALVYSGSGSREKPSARLGSVFDTHLVRPVGAYLRQSVRKPASRIFGENGISLTRHYRLISSQRTNLSAREKQLLQDRYGHEFSHALQEFCSMYSGETSAPELPHAYSSDNLLPL